MIRLRALGPPQVTSNAGQTVRPVVLQPKRLALLTYLSAATPAGFRRRDELLPLFWPESDGHRARSALRKSLHHLRRDLGSDALPGRGDEVAVDPEVVWTDVRAFRQAVAEGSPVRALELYRGDLFEACHARGCHGFESWLDEERIALRRMAASASLEVAETRAEAGEPHQAAELARRASGLSPFDEAVHRRALEILDRIGDRAGALRLHQSFARRLALELEAEPAPETEALIDEVRRRQSGASRRVGPRRLAVLPLASIGATPEQEYFADGMTEELISVLARLSGLAVIARTSVLDYGGGPKSVGEIASELRVGYVLEGSVRRADDRLRITMRLVDGESEAHLWSKAYDRTVGDVFRIQTDIARRVADALEVALNRTEKVRLEREPTTDVDAYDLYLLGRYHFNTRNEAGFRRAIEHFQAAIDRDPDFALAYAGLSETYVLAALGFSWIPDAMGLAQEAATTALGLDDALPEAHGALGYVALLADWDLATADRELQRAVELSPSRAQNFQFLSHVAQFSRRFHEAIRLMRRAHELDPHSVVIRNEMGWVPTFLGDFETAERHYRRALAMDPSFAMAHYNLGGLLEQDDRLELAIHHLRQAVALSDRVPLMVSCLGGALARAGHRSEARKLIQEIESAMDRGGSLWLWKAAIHDALGEREEALDCIERSIEAREPVAMLFDTRHFLFRLSLRDEPRFHELRERVYRILGLDWPQPLI